jgi:hypothetical protein
LLFVVVGVDEGEAKEAHEKALTGGEDDEDDDDEDEDEDEDEEESSSDDDDDDDNDDNDDNNTNNTNTNNNNNSEEEDAKSPRKTPRESPEYAFCCRAMLNTDFFFFSYLHNSGEKLTKRASRSTSGRKLSEKKPNSERRTKSYVFYFLLTNHN